MPSILDKYIGREFVPPFIGGIAGFTVMLLSGTLFELVDYIFSRNIGVSVVAELLLYSLPRFVVLTMPIAALFATLLSLGRLVGDSEMVAIRSAGVPWHRTMIPLMLAAVLVSGAAFVLNEYIVPNAEHRAQNVVREMIFQEVMPDVEENVFFRGTGERYFYVGQIDSTNNTLKRVLIYETEGSRYPGIISAESGTFEDAVWRLKNGVSREFDTRGHTVHEARWDELEYAMPEGEIPFFGNQKTTDEMTRKELGEYIALFKKSGFDVKRFEVEYHMKVAMPVATLLWMFIGAPLSLRSKRSARVFGIVVAILVTFVYFTLAALFRSLGGNGVLPPLWAAWATNIIFFGLGVWLNVRANRM